MNFVLLVIMCVITAVMSGLDEGKGNQSADFFEKGAEPSSNVALDALVTFGCVVCSFVY